MADPVLKVEIAFDSDPMDDTPTWTDVTADVRDMPGVQITRGGPGQAGQPDNAGMCTFTLSNRARLYDPTYAAGTYYGKLRARKQVRVTCTHSATTYPMFYGFVTGFPVTGAAMGKDSVVEVTAYDALSVLAGSRLSSDPLADYVASIGTCSMWLRQLDANRWYDAVGSVSCLPGAGLFDISPSSIVGSTSPGWKTDGTAFGALLPVFTDASTWSVSMWFSTTAAGPISSTPGEPDAPLITRSADYLPIYELQVVTGGVLRWQGTAVFGVYTIVTSSVFVADGRPHHVAVTCNGSTISIYVDGVLDAAATTSTSGGGHFAIEIDRVGQSLNPAVYVNPTGRALWASTLWDVQLFSAALTSQQVAAISGLGSGIAVESTADRVTRILDDVGWPAAWRDIATDTRGTVGELVYTGQSALTALQQVERSEQGRIFAAKDGALTFTGRYTWLEVTRSNTAQATFSDDGAGEGYRTFGYNPGDEDICNDMTVQNSLNSARSTDATSKTAYGTTADTTDTNLSTYAQLRDMAAGLVYLRKDPATRFAPMTVGPTTWATVLGLELGDRIAIESTPMGVGTQAVQAALIDSIAWDISAASGWWFTVAGSPVPANSFWVLGVSVLGTDTVPGF